MTSDRLQLKTPSLLDNERGFALPFTIFLVTIITIMLAAAFTRATSDHLVASNSSTEVSALAVAQSGLQAFLLAGDTMTERPAPSDSFRFNVTGGYAWIHPDLIYQPADTAFGFTYIVRSTGYVIQPSVGPDPQATRTIAQFARWRAGELPGVAALVALNGLVHTNADHRLIFDGNDSTCELPHSYVGATRAIRGPGGSGLPGSLDTLEGLSPLISGSASDIGDELGIDWEAATTDSVLNPDYTSLGSYPDYPTYLISGDAELNDSGDGLLVVTGNLELDPSAFIQWNGVVLVGGQLIAPTNPNPVVNRTVFYGMVVTGLNALTGPAPDPNEITLDNQSFEIHYSSCEVRNALERFTGFHTINNTWVDNWATY